MKYNVEIRDEDIKQCVVEMSYTVIENLLKDFGSTDEITAFAKKAMEWYVHEFVQENLYDIVWDIVYNKMCLDSDHFDEKNGGKD